MPKHKTQPLCRYCGGKIAKRTITVRFGGFMSNRKDRPATWADAQRLVNDGTIVSVRYATKARGDNGVPFDVDRFVCEAGVWDGESYVDSFFCNGEHAKRFAYMLARGGHCTTDYNDAVLAQSVKNLA